MLRMLWAFRFDQNTQIRPARGGETFQAKLTNHPRQSPTVRPSSTCFPVFSSPTATVEVVGNTGKWSSEKAGVGGLVSTSHLQAASDEAVLFRATGASCSALACFRIGMLGRLLGQTDFAHQFGVTRIGAQGIERVVSPEGDQPSVVLLICRVKQLEGMILVAQVRI